MGDAEILSCGYIDTSNGCVMTQPRVMAMVWAKAKEKADTDKSYQKEIISLQRETSAARIEKGNALEKSQILDLQLLPRAKMCAESVTEFRRRMESKGGE